MRCSIARTTTLALSWGIFHCGIFTWKCYIGVYENKICYEMRVRDEMTLARSASIEKIKREERNDEKRSAKTGIVLTNKYEIIV